MGLAGFVFYDVSIAGESEVYFKAYLNTTIDVPADTWQEFNLDTEEFDIGNNYNIDTDVFTVPEDSYYQVIVRVYFYGINSGNFGSIGVFIQNIQVSTISEYNTYGSFTNIQLSEVYWLNALETLHIEIYHNDLGIGPQQLSGVFATTIHRNYLIVYKI